MQAIYGQIEKYFVKFYFAAGNKKAIFCMRESNGH